MAGRRGRDRRGGHVDPRHDDRQRRARDAVAGARLAAQHDPMGLDGLHARARDRDPAHRLDVGALRGEADLHGLGGSVRRRVRALRAGVVRRLADLLPRAPGLRRRDDHAGRDEPARPDGRPHAGRPGDGGDGSADAARTDSRPGDRRADRGLRLLALDLLRQRARRRRGAGDGLPPAARRRGARGRGQARLDRGAAARRRPGRHRLRHRPGAPARCLWRCSCATPGAPRGRCST